MIRATSFVGLMVVALAPIAGIAFVQVQPKATPTQATTLFKTKVQPPVKTYCAPCHTGKTALGGFDVTAPMVAADLAKWEIQWRAAARRIADKSMPPAGSKMPTAAERKSMSESILKILGPPKKTAEAPIKRSTLRRLNRAEYNNTIRDLFYGMPFTPADDFPSDDVGYGFDNVGDVLSISPLLMERYLDAAEAVARKAIVVPKVVTRVYDSANLTLVGSATFNEMIGMFSKATATGKAKIERAGTYRIRIHAFGQQAGPEVVKMSLRVDKVRIAVFDVSAKDVPAPYEVQVDMQTGDREIEIGFINDYYKPDDPNPANRDRNLILHSFELIAPPLDAKAIPQSHRKILFVKPDANNSAATAKTILAAFASRAYRRPVTKDEVEKLAAFVAMAQKDGEPFERGIQVAITAVLASPKFLFRSEIDPPLSGGNSRPLDSYELASRLSYFLWSSMPDEVLFEKARAGTLVQPSVLEKEIERMIDDPKSSALTENFAAQWLQLRKLATLSPDPELFPEFNADLRKSMIRETEMYFDHVLRKNRPLTEFLTSNYAFVDERLAKLYGIEGFSGRGFQRVELKDKRRGGLLTQASVLTVTSNPNRTSPVKRGKYVLEQILGDPPPPPPPGAGVIEGDTDKAPTKTMKERLAKHRRDPACATCHLKMDTMGFALENYDPIGKWREKDGEFPIDPSGKLADGRVFRGAQDLQTMLISQRVDFTKSLAEKVLTYALGRGIGPEDEANLKQIVASTEKGGGTLAQMVRAIILSDLFRTKRIAK